MITQASAAIENQKLMIAELKQVTELWNSILTRQAGVVEAVLKLSAEMDKARAELRSSITGILQIPIAIVIIGAASWAFFVTYIEEYTWIIIMAVAAFRYIGDSITGVVKLLGLRRGNNGEK
jgi:hypothetical protein